MDQPFIAFDWCGFGEKSGRLTFVGPKSDGWWTHVQGSATLVCGPDFSPIEWDETQLSWLFKYKGRGISIYSCTEDGPYRARPEKCKGTVDDTILQLEEKLRKLGWVYFRGGPLDGRMTKPNPGGEAKALKLENGLCACYLKEPVLEFQFAKDGDYHFFRTIPESELVKLPKYKVGDLLGLIPEKFKELTLKLRVTEIRSDQSFPPKILYRFKVENQREVEFPFPTAAYFESELDRFNAVVISE